MKHLMIGLSLGLMTTGSFAQEVQRDTVRTHTKYLSDITIVGRNTRADIHFLPEIVGTQINAGKKNSLIVMDNVQGNVVTNTMRQVMAKVPGIQIWESDPSGIQIGIGARGLSPNRSWEFNVRQNGYDISSDPFGYPEAYYTPQLNSVQRIQVVRGAGSLQYGPQFGGMVNFIMKNGSELNKPFQFETQQTAGSFGLFNTYNAIGGETNKAHYYAFWDKRLGNGSRPNSRFDVSTGFGSFTWKASNKLKLGIEYTHFNYVAQQPGGLTDAQFAADHLQSLRSRNWFNVQFNILALNADYTITDNSRINIKVFGMTGDRNSNGFMSTPNIKDTVNAATLQYNNRRVDIDRYRNAGAELRYINEYKIGSLKNTVAAGVRYFRGNTARMQNGRGDTGTDYNINTSAPFGTDLDFVTSNTAFFAENIIHIGKKLILIPGVRYETIRNTAEGRISFNSNGSENKVSNEIRNRNFALLGVGAEYHIGNTELYANWSQAYRPALFSDLTANPTTDVIDENLKDAKGYNADLGWRGSIKEFLFFDVSGYYLKYNNRIGLIAQQRTDGSFYNFRTNVGNSTSKGAELLVEFSPVKAFVKNSTFGNITLFASLAFIDARYGDFRVVTRSGNTLTETTLKDKRVENAPQRIFRTGVTYAYKKLTATVQYNYTGDAFSDANNTVAPVTTGVNGLIPSYQIVDVSATYKFTERFFVKGGLNNLFNEKYFTRRAGGYPGPGIMSADPRNFFLTIGAKF
ncbi:TonB-dependent receptor [Lacibacter sp. MH-610]|uniref:TonB-dependent receptor family protein n=1 Tax=Lacibacter sp. MH-610 TaxID=3020883 RepID=UPI003891C2E2